MHVLIFGGTGFIGKYLTEELLANGYEVSTVTRNRGKAAKDMLKKVQVHEWDSSKPLSSISDLTEVDVVVNLAGESIGSRRWSNSVKQEILASRIKTTRAIVSAINNCTIQPKVLISASAVGFYGPHGDEEITEGEVAGKDFLAEVCREWENEAYKTQNNLTRVLTIRIGVVLGKAGALTRMTMPFNYFLGGPLGTGKQWLSWIHIKDLAGMIRFAIEHEELTGPLNGTAPQPAKMRYF
ncbi:MAG: TIGR01777 family oxidoreductase, partial [Bacillota bacterium]